MNLQDVLIVEELRKNKITEDNFVCLKSYNLIITLFFVVKKYFLE